MKELLATAILILVQERYLKLYCYYNGGASDHFYTIIMQLRLHDTTVPWSCKSGHDWHHCSNDRVYTVAIMDNNCHVKLEIYWH